MKNFFNLLFSTSTMVITILMFAVAMVTATIIENDFGTVTAKAVVYNTKWFELLMLILTINFMGNIFKYKLFRKEKLPILVFHLAFIVVLLGAFITRYFGYEGIMPIREGKESSIVYSDKAYITVNVDDGTTMKTYENEVQFSQLGSNSFKINKIFGANEARGINKILDVPFSIELLDFVPKVKQLFEQSNNAESHLHIVEASSGKRQDYYLKDGEVKSIRSILFSYNNPVEGGMNFFKKDKKITLQSPFEGNMMEMNTQELYSINKDSIYPLHIKRLYSFQRIRFVIAGVEKGHLVKKTAPIVEYSTFPYDAVTLKINSGEEEKYIEISGATGRSPHPSNVSLNGLNFDIFYGSKEILLDFSIKLRNFEMQRYPGTNSASSYASEISVLDHDEIFDYRIFMNHVLDYKGYRFFQSSYDKDEKGTILSVNYDYWGTLITYIGYFLMGLGMFVSLYWGKTRFRKLSKNLKELSRKKGTVLLILLGINGFTYAQEVASLNTISVSKIHADKFGRLLIQDHQGRIKPINTYALEALRKVYKKDKYKGLTAEQVLLSAQLNPKKWSGQLIVKVKERELGNEATKILKVKESYTSMNNFFVNGKYYMQNKVSESFRKKNTNRTATDKEIINLDERANVWWNILNGNLMHIYPKSGDLNNTWYTGTNDRIFVEQDTIVLKMHQIYMAALRKAIETNNYSEADEYLRLIAKYQKDINLSIIPSDRKVNLEIKYNKWDIFKRLLFYYMIIGFIFLTLAFVNLFEPDSKKIIYLLKAFSFLTILGVLVHVTGMGIRWYVSGHEPWSNGYEAIVFVAFITIVAGLIFSKNRSKFTLASTVLFASFLLGIAHGSMMSPEMTNLVPVLKSYWLMIHVAVIITSYGFLGLGSLLGFVVLLLYILRNRKNAKRFNSTINELTYINELTLIVGLYTLTIGTFLGGVWANESWGRYWSWDPKEVWSLISMMIYVFVLHMRLIPSLKGKFVFNVVSLFAIATLIMTFFGVNYYLSGMHSYATGDPVPIPKWIYLAIGFFVIFSIFSYWKYKHFKDS